MMKTEDTKLQSQNWKTIKSRSESHREEHYSKEHEVDKTGRCEKCKATFGTHQGARRRI